MNSSPVILIVDDEPKALILLRNLLEPLGYRLCAAENGADAIALALRERPDAILLDVMMPHLDGFEVCERMRAHPELETVPILLLTALDDRDSRLRGLACGADDFVTKPFDSTELRLRLRTITRLNRFRRLHEESSRLDAALKHSREGIVLAELDGTILVRNAAFDALLAESERTRANFFDYLDSNEALRFQAELAAGTGSQPARECTLRGGRAPDTIVEIVHGLVPWERRVIAQFHLRDVTEKKSLEAQLLRSQRIELLGQVSSSVIHDVNNVLAAILCATDLMKMDDPPESMLRQLNQVGAAVRRGTGMLRQILMFARGNDAPLQELDPVPVIEEVASLARDTLGPHFPLRLENQLGPVTIRADSTQIHQIIMNLCVNARDAMPRGGNVIVRLDEASLSAEDLAAVRSDAAPGRYMRISVRDHGTGIPPEVRARLFDPFFTTKEKGKGTGLGLATVMRLMKRHGGFVTVETEVGRGTCFACHFPLASAAVAGG